MTKPGMFWLTFAHLSLRPNFPLSGSLSFPLSGKFGLRPDRKNDFTFWINFRSAESLVSAKDERKSEPKVKVTQCCHLANLAALMPIQLLIYREMLLTIAVTVFTYCCHGNIRRDSIVKHYRSETTTPLSPLRRKLGYRHCDKKSWYAALLCSEDGGRRITQINWEDARTARLTRLTHLLQR